MSLKRKKKELTPRQYRVRFVAASCLVLLMLTVCLVSRKPGRAGRPDHVNPLKIMDTHLDTLLERGFGEGVEVTAKGGLETIEEKSEEAWELERITSELAALTELREMSGLPESDRERDLAARAAELKGLTSGQIPARAYVRRLTLRLTGDSTVTCFQKTGGDLKNSRLELVTPVRKTAGKDMNSLDSLLSADFDFNTIIK